MEVLATLVHHGFCQYEGGCPHDPPPRMFAYRSTQRVVRFDCATDSKGSYPCAIEHEGVLYVLQKNDEMPVYTEAYVARNPAIEVEQTVEHYWPGTAPGEPGHDANEEGSRQCAIERAKKRGEWAIARDLKYKLERSALYGKSIESTAMLGDVDRYSGLHTQECFDYARRTAKESGVAHCIVQCADARSARLATNARKVPLGGTGDIDKARQYAVDELSACGVSSKRALEVLNAFEGAAVSELASLETCTSTKETQESISTWAMNTFGAAQSNVRVAARANEEMAELLRVLASGDASRKAPEEVADVLIVLYCLATRLGVDVHAEVDRKMEINRARKWKLDGTGHGYHDREYGEGDHCALSNRDVKDFDK